METQSRGSTCAQVSSQEFRTKGTLSFLMRTCEIDEFETVDDTAMMFRCR